MSLKRHIGQQVALATAAFCALLALPAFGAFRVAVEGARTGRYMDAECAGRRRIPRRLRCRTLRDEPPATATAGRDCYGQPLKRGKFSSRHQAGRDALICAFAPAA